MNQIFRRCCSPPIAAAASSAAILGGIWWHQRQQQLTAACDDAPRSTSKLLFLGSGSSTGCPKPLCSMLYQEQHAAGDNDLVLNQKTFERYCKTSRVAIQGDPRFNRDYRNNPSLLIQFVDDSSADKVRNVVIDVGKTFRETSLRWMPQHNIRSLDAVILTHHHMDAAGGLDDLRGFQRVAIPSSGNMHDRNAPPARVPISVYLSQECLDEVASQFPWLFPKQKGPPTSTVKRDVAALDVQVIEDFVPFDAKGLKVVPLPVWHGDDLICLGYAFSLPDKNGTTTNVVYLSDISRMKPTTLEYIQTNLPPTDIFVCDTLLRDQIHPVHFNLQQATELARQIGARQTYLIGMNCDTFPPHKEMNEELARDVDIPIAFAHDGLVLNL